MNGIEHFFWLAAQSFVFLVLWPPAGILMLMGILGVAATAEQVARIQWQQVVAAVLPPLILPMAILLCGVLLAHDTALDTPSPRWPEWLVEGLLAAHLPLAAALTASVRDARWFVLSVCVATFGYSWAASFMSLMSVSGQWL
jgi:hypothetical protein